MKDIHARAERRARTPTNLGIISRMLRFGVAFNVVAPWAARPSLPSEALDIMAGRYHAPAHHVEAQSFAAWVQAKPDD